MSHNQEVWREFEDNQLSHSAAHYLMTILELHEENGYARLTDVAKRLGITRGSCSISLKALRKKSLVAEDDNKFLLLTPEGARLAKIVRLNDQLIESLLTDLVGVSSAQAEIDACKIEHLLSIESSLQLCDLVQFLKSGHPAVTTFLKALSSYRKTHSHNPARCAQCDENCVLQELKAAG